MIHTVEFVDHMAMFSEKYYQHLAMLYLVAVTYPVGILLLPVALGIVSTSKLCEVFCTCQGVDSQRARIASTVECSSQSRATHFSLPYTGKFTAISYGSMESHSVAPYIEAHNDSVHTETEYGAISSCEDKDASPQSQSPDGLMRDVRPLTHDEIKHCIEIHYMYREQHKETDCGGTLTSSCEEREVISIHTGQSPDILTSAAKELDSAPTITPPCEPCPPKQTYLPGKSESLER